MLRSLYSGVSGIKNHQIRMDTISNNIANVNTTGFKAARANFQDSLNQTLRGGGAGRNPMQAGTGISVGSIGTKMEQGPLQNTGRSLDLAISGNGFFTVSDGTNTYYTRDGSFFIANIEGTNYLVNSNGLYVQGEGGNIAFDGDVTGFNVEKNGSITYYTSDEPDTPNTDLSIPITIFPNQEGLIKVGNSLYKSDEGLTGAPAAYEAGTEGAGTIEGGYLEMSNADMSEEFTNMITTQRGYQANARVVTVSDTLLEELIQLKR